MTNVTTQEKESVQSAVAGGVANPADKARMHGALGKLLIRQKRWSHAVGELNQAISFEPKNQNWLMARSEALEKLGQINPALMDAADAVMLDSKNPEASDRLGILLVAARKFDQAALCFAEALKLKPDNLNYCQHLARTFELMEAPKAAIELYQAMIAQDPMRELTYHQVANLLEATGDYAGVLAVYEQAIENNCVTSEIYRHAGMAARKLDMHDLAKARFMAGLALKPNDAVLLHFVSLGNQTTPKSLPDAFVAERYNQLAATYESELILRNIRAPGLIRSALIKIRPRISPDRPNPQKLSSVLDLGCGTGIIGIMVSDLTVLLKGVDLSGQMLNLAQSKGIYHELQHVSAQKILTDETRMYEVITASGLMPYIGEAENFAAILYSRLQPNGVAIFDFESGEDSDRYALNSSGLFLHHPDYIKLSLEKAGFEIAAFDSELLWRHDGVDHMGYVVTAVKPLV
ncbi:MAG: methyltransferase domain-containing protein [Candidatus Symbiobacter sp.]|nr:methyltransferase domain-containing protein [Candidatus Symbiobacter sp.]